MKTRKKPLTSSQEKGLAAWNKYTGEQREKPLNFFQWFFLLPRYDRKARKAGKFPEIETDTSRRRFDEDEESYSYDGLGFLPYFDTYYQDHDMGEIPGLEEELENEY